VEFIEDSGDFEATQVRMHWVSVQPRGMPWARLIVFHGYGDHGGRYRHVMHYFAAHGVASHAFDLRGHGRASGRRGFIWQWDGYLDDASAALKEEARLTTAPAPRFLLGHSHGGLVVAMGVIRQMFVADGVILSAPYFQNGVPVRAGRVALARAVGLIVPWARFRSGVQERWISSDAQMLADSRADPLLLRTVTPRWYVSMLGAQSEALRRAGEFKLPLLCLTGEEDTIAVPAAVERFCESAGSGDKTLIRYPGLLHELLRESSREKIFGDVLGWMRRVGGTVE
jgi:lysophospholipase